MPQTLLNQAELNDEDLFQAFLRRQQRAQGQAQQGLTRQFAARGITGSGEEQEALSNLGAQFGEQSGQLLSQLQRDALERRLQNKQFQQQFGLQERQLAQQGEQFGRQFGLQERGQGLDEAFRRAQLGQQGEQFGKTFGLQEREQGLNEAFRRLQLGQQESQFGRQFGLQERGQLADIEAKNRQFGLQERELGQQNELERLRLAQQGEQFGQQFGLQREQFGEQRRQTDLEEAFRRLQLGQQGEQFGKTFGLQEREFGEQVRQASPEFRKQLLQQQFEEEQRQQAAMLGIPIEQLTQRARETEEGQRALLLRELAGQGLISPGQADIGAQQLRSLLGGPTTGIDQGRELAILDRLRGGNIQGSDLGIFGNAFLNAIKNAPAQEKEITPLGNNTFKIAKRGFPFSFIVDANGNVVGRG